MPVYLQSVEALTSQSGVKSIIYGGPKFGKTTLLATGPRPVIFSAERGLLSLRGSRLPAWEVTTKAHLDEGLMWAQNSYEAKQFDTLGLDSISEIAELVLIAEQERVKREKIKNGYEAYQVLARDVMDTLRKYRDLKQKHVVFIAKEEWDKDETSGQSKFRPSMPGKQLTMQLPYMFDEILRLEMHPNYQTGASDRWLRTFPDATTVAGDRSGRLNPYEPPNLDAIFRKMMA